MNTRITGRHMDITDGIRSHVEKKLARLQRLAHNVSEIEVILDAQGGQTHKIEIIVRVDHAPPFVVQEKGENLHACLDAAVDKLETQMARHKDKTHAHKGRSSMGEAAADVIDSQEQEL